MFPNPPQAVIETNAKKGLRESVPPGFPYLYIQFGYGAGMLHVIDDETKFDKDLGRQVRGVQYVWGRCGKV